VSPVKVHIKGSRRKSSYPGGSDFFTLVREDVQVNGHEVKCNENVYNLKYPLPEQGELEDLVETWRIPSIKWYWEDADGKHVYQCPDWRKKGEQFPGYPKKSKEKEGRVYGED